ncbi:hypothetical protein [Paraburkholderia guartelaensis]|uniref:hypothetical protein n=1 Tax=Paraburkholderia guartelaensis TaxID=2546446 RepID=UPI001407A50B|nr:hypothetical protein [Paraburkholderia guartelaensis]
MRAWAPGCAQIDVRATVNRDVYCRRKAIENANSFEASINDGYACIDGINAALCRIPH